MSEKMPNPKNDNPEGLSPYEEFLRQKYLGDEYDEAEYGDPEEIEAGNLLRLARNRFAKARIEVESHFFKKLFGGKKRREELSAAAEELKRSELRVAKLEFAEAIENIAKMKQNPEENTDELTEKQESLSQTMAAYVFHNMQQTAKKTSEVHDNMLGERSKFQKIAAKIGGWFARGGKVSQWLKLGGSGAVAGFATASIATWPITTAVGLGVGLATAGAIKQSVMEERRGEERISDDSKDAWEDVFKRTAEGSKGADAAIEAMIEASVDISQESSEERQEQLRKKVRSAMSKIAVGYALGSVVGASLESVFSSTEDKTVGQVTGGGEGGSNATSSGAGTKVDSFGSGAELKTGMGSSSVQPEVGSYEYPWDWAVAQFGAENATNELHRLAEIAQANGHTVEWIANPNGTESLAVDGMTQTDKIVGVLSKFS